MKKEKTISELTVKEMKSINGGCCSCMPEGPDYPIDIWGQPDIWRRPDITTIIGPFIIH